MTFPTMAETSGSLGSSASQSVPLPACSVGDLLIVYANVAGDAPDQTWTFDSSTSKFTIVTSGKQVFDSFWSGYRIVQTGDSVVGATGTLTVGFGGGSYPLQYIVHRFTSWHGTTPPEGAAVSAAGNNYCNPPAITPSWGAADTSWFAVYGRWNRFITGNPSGYTTTSEPANQGLISTRKDLNAASEDPGNFTTDAGTYGFAVTMAVRPFAAASTIKGMPIYRRLLIARRRVL